MSKDSEYRARFKTRWMEQVMIACEKFASEVQEAEQHNGDSEYPTLRYALNELTAELWNKGFKSSDLKMFLETAVRNQFANRDDEDNGYTRNSWRADKK